MEVNLSNVLDVLEHNIYLFDRANVKSSNTIFVSLDVFELMSKRLEWTITESTNFKNAQYHGKDLIICLHRKNFIHVDLV